MTPQRTKPPEGGPGLLAGVSGKPNHTTPAPIKAFRRELRIILNGCHRVASGYSLAWDDYERLHAAYQHVYTVTEAAHNDQ